MQLWHGELPENLDGQRLATPGLAETLRGIFFSLSCGQNRPAKSAAVDAAREELQFHRYEKALIDLGYRRGRSGGNGRLRADKETGGASEGRASRRAFRPSRIGSAVSRRAVHSADHV